MTRSVTRVLAALGIVATTTWACSSPTDLSTTPTTVATLTETFSGVLTPAGTIVFPFNTANAGSLTASLTTVSPDGSLSIGMDLGAWDGVSCTPVIRTPNAVEGTAVNGNVNGAGSLCVLVYDASSVLLNPESVVVTVSHP